LFTSLFSTTTVTTQHEALSIWLSFYIITIFNSPYLLIYYILLSNLDARFSRI
jgi:hypothetical protein